MLGEVLPLLPTLENLNLEENAINDLKFECIIPALVSLSNLKSLNLAKNSLTHLSIERYFKNLADENIDKSLKLSKLNLIGCNLKDEGITVIFQGILNNMSLFKNLGHLQINAIKTQKFCLPMLKKFIS